MEKVVTVVHLQWEGPFSWSEKDKLNSPTDYGVYQIYGCHCVYGVDTLLYIGKAQEQKFAMRLGQEERWQYHQDFQRLSIYIGRCSGWEGTPPDEVWSDLIDRAEKLLILAHRPAWNAQMEIDGHNPRLQEFHILNWGCHRGLLPEVSGWRHSSKFDDERGYKPYSEAGGPDQREKISGVELNP
jgi:hypothetical protein